VLQVRDVLGAIAVEAGPLKRLARHPARCCQPLAAAPAARAVGRTMATGNSVGHWQQYWPLAATPVTGS
jgi:hypothetical protein